MRGGDPGWSAPSTCSLRRTAILGSSAQAPVAGDRDLHGDHGGVLRAVPSTTARAEPWLKAAGQPQQHGSPRRAGPRWAHRCGRGTRGDEPRQLAAPTQPIDVLPGQPAPSACRRETTPHWSCSRGRSRLSMTAPSHDPGRECDLGRTARLTSSADRTAARRCVVFCRPMTCRNTTLRRPADGFTRDPVKPRTHGLVGLVRRSGREATPSCRGTGPRSGTPRRRWVAEGQPRALAAATTSTRPVPLSNEVL